MTSRATPSKIQIHLIRALSPRHPVDLALDLLPELLHLGLVRFKIAQPLADDGLDLRHGRLPRVPHRQHVHVGLPEDVVLHEHPAPGPVAGLACVPPHVADHVVDLLLGHEGREVHRGVVAVLPSLGGGLLRLGLLDDAEALAPEEAEEVGADLLGVRLDLP